MSPSVRPGALGEEEVLRDIERRAGARFRDIGMAEIAEDEPMSTEALGGYITSGRCWVAVDSARSPVGYLLADLVDGNAHVEQVSVVPEHQGQGVGRSLIEAVAAWASAQGVTAVTLTTFTDVPWNQPLYEHLGFGVMSEQEIGPELRQLREHEASKGLDPDSRVCMRLEL